MSDTEALLKQIVKILGEKGTVRRMAKDPNEEALLIKTREHQNALFLKEKWGGSSQYPSLEANGRALPAWYGAGVSPAVCSIPVYFSVNLFHVTEAGMAHGFVK